MGKTAFSGPVFGAWGLLWASSPGQVSSGASTALFAATVVPANEDWFVGAVGVQASSNSSNAQIKLKAEGGNAGTLLITSAGASTSAWNVVNTVGSSGGSSGPIGFYVPAGSTMRLVSTAINPIGGVHVMVHGWRQWIAVGNLDIAANFNVSTRSFGN